MLQHKKRPAEYKPNSGEIESTSNELTPTYVRAPTTGAQAMGALAVGALAIGALAIGRLAIGRARIRRLETDKLVVGRLHVTDQVEMRGIPPIERDKAPYPFVPGERPEKRGAPLI